MAVSGSSHEDFVRITVEAGSVVADVDGESVVGHPRHDADLAAPVAGRVVDEDLEDLAGGGLGDGRRWHAGLDVHSQGTAVGREAAVPAPFEIIEDGA